MTKSGCSPGLASPPSVLLKINIVAGGIGHVKNVHFSVSELILGVAYGERAPH